MPMKWPVILLKSGSYPSSSLTDSISRSQVPDPRADNTLSFLVELLHWFFFFFWVLVTQSCLALCGPRLWPARVLCPWDSPGKDTGVGCHFLLQMIFLTQGLNPGLLHHRWTLSPSEPPGKDASSITIWKIQFFSTLPSILSSSNICTWLLERP